MCGVRGPGWLGSGCESCCNGSADKCSSIHGRHFTPFERKGNRDSMKKGRSDDTRSPFLARLKSEIKPQTELHAARVMCAVQVQKGAATSEAVIDAVELCVIEDVERLPTEFESGPFFDGKAFKDTEVEVEASRIVQGVPPDVAKSQPTRGGIGRRVVSERSRDGRILIGCKSSAGISHQIGTRASCRRAVPHASVIWEAASVDNTERRAGLGNCDARDLPAGKRLVSQATAPEKRQRIDIADREAVAQIEIGTGPIPCDVVSVHERVVTAVRGIVDGVAVCVGEAQCKVAQCPVHSNL